MGGLYLGWGRGATMSILLLHRKEGSLEEQGSEKTGRRKQPALVSDPHTTSHVEISGLQFSFAPPPLYGLNRAGQGLASGCGWQGAMSFPRVTSLPGLSAPGTARQWGPLHSFRIPPSGAGGWGD